MSANVARGRDVPMVIARGVMPRDSRTQSTQCWPTAAGVRHSGHAGRPHRVQASPVGRSGCRTHTVRGADGGGGNGWFS
ncbi:hypothetical protein GCM10009773_04070 [Williamsia serinedens]